MFALKKDIENSKNAKIFWKQNEAIEFSKSDPNFLVFSREVSEDGRRFYIVTDAISMWNILQNIPVMQKNFHEVIPEGFPCKLYFDLEFKYDCNLCNGDEMVDIFVKLVCWGLKKHFNICCDMNNVLWLTASSKEKFSSHLIFQMDNVLFSNSIEAGNFVHYLCHVINNPTEETEEEKISYFKKPSTEDLKKLIITNKDKKEVFCDLFVYRKNNNFRLFSCSKFNTDRPLKVSDKNEYVFPSFKKNQNIFLSSLVTYHEKRDNATLLHFEDSYKPKPKKKTKITVIPPAENKNEIIPPEEVIVDEYQQILNDSLSHEEEQEYLEICLQIEIQLHTKSILKKKYINFKNEMCVNVRK